MSGVPEPASLRVAVIGGGRMGAGIAHAFLVRGHDVFIAETGAQAAETAREQVHRQLSASIDRGRVVGPLESLAAKATFVSDVAMIPADTDMVIEAVPEDLDLKARLFAAVEKVVGSDAVLASNTSALSITAIAESLENPRRLVGMHFFNPVPASLLVEVVRGAATAAPVIESVCAVVEHLDKSAIVVRDSPGFATSRLGIALGLEAIRMLESGVASAEDIDKAMALGYRHPIGPLRLTDMVGLDVRLAVAEHLEETLGPRFAPPQLLRVKVAEGELGMKTGRGFYEWTAG